MPAGRPTKYNSEMCERIIAMGKQGFSKHEMALDLGIAMSTFDEWQNKNDEFSVAVKEAVSFSQGKWEQHGRMVSFGMAETNPTTYMFNMKNRFKESWSDTTKSELTGAGGKDLPSIKLEFVKPDEAK